MSKIHHATRARAEKAGCEILDAAGGGFRLVRNGALSIETFETARAAADAAHDEGTEFETPSRNRSGVMVISYHKAYTANGGGCGDDLDRHLRSILLTDSGVDLVRLRQIADDNGVWNPRWETLNPGMQRMNLANRLRGLLRNDASTELNLGGLISRFGVQAKPPKKGG